jgi:hypothetical protein
MANYFQSQIGILRWCVELGHIDIITEVSMLSTFLCMLREGHLDAVYHLFAYMSLYHNARVVFDPGNVTSTFVIVPFQCNSKINCPSPVCCDFIIA